MKEEVEEEVEETQEEIYSNKEAMIQTLLEDLLEEALRFVCSNLLCICLLKGLVPKMDLSSHRNLLEGTFGTIARAMARATPDTSKGKRTFSECLIKGKWLIFHPPDHVYSGCILHSPL